MKQAARAHFVVLGLMLALALAGCGGSGRAHGTATLWVTRDRGAHVIFSGTVPAGSDGIRTVERKLKVTTRYGGRYLQSVNDLAGSLTKQEDWFFYVDGIEGGRSAAEVKIHPGDVLWWDFRRWGPSTMHIPVVLGAYPHPFVDTRTSVVAPERWQTVGTQLAKQVHGVRNSQTPLRNYILVTAAFAPEHVRIYPFRHGVVLELGYAVAKRLAADPSLFRYRFGA